MRNPAERGSTPLLTPERLADIEARLAAEGRVVAAELARLYATSEDTIRRDLRALAAAGRCRRVYGGALPPALQPALPPTPARGPVSARARVAPAAKAALGAALARLVEPGMTVFIDAGSTTLACAEHLAAAAAGGRLAAGVTAVTHAPGIAAALVEAPGLRLVTIGGEIDPQVGAALGAAALAAIAPLRFDLLLLGACGVDPAAGITAQRAEDAAVKRALAARAGRVAAAADRGKLGAAAAFGVIDLAAVDLLAIEAATPAALRERLAAAGAHILDVETGR